MQKVNINGNEITYYKKDELANADLECKRSLYEETYRLCDIMSTQLNVDCPDIALSEQMRFIDQNGQLSVEGARTYKPEEVPGLENTLILMSLEDFDALLYTGTLAHEMRHIWQNKYLPEINKNPAMGFDESLMHPAEIDADGYAIWYLSYAANIHIERAATIMCPEEKKYYPKEYMYRIEKAKEIQTSFYEKTKDKSCEFENKKKRPFFFDGIRKFFK